MDIPKKIQDAISNNKLVIFAGSGLSTKFNLPNWTKLVEDIIKEINQKEFNVYLPVMEVGGMKPIEVLDKLKPKHNEIKGYIKNNFQIKNGDFTLHKNLLKLSGQIITTNFDDAFEKASNNSIIPAIYTSDYNISEINKNNNDYIFKLHGSFNEPDHCIIFNDQYEQLYANERSAKEKLKSIFTEKIILFIGFSFSDPDINLIFNNLDKAFGNNNKHFILTTNPKSFENYNFLEPIHLNKYDEIDLFIEKCLDFKKSNKPTITSVNSISKQEKLIRKIAILYPEPIDIDFKDDLSKLVNCFESLDSEIHLGKLNIKTVSKIDDYDLLVIISKVFKSNIYIEDDNLKSDLISPDEICSNIPNEKLPVIFITNENLPPVLSHPCVFISTFRNQIINRFIHKALKENDLKFENEEIVINLNKLLDAKINKGVAKISSIYNNNKNLEIGKKCLTNLIGRVEEQASIALKLLSIKKTNKLLNIKASGGTGKTTIIKKVAYELYNRGYYREGVNFRSCENVKSYADFEEIIINGFNLTNILNFRNYLSDNYQNNKIDLLVILDNFETVVNSLSTNDFDLVINLLKFTTDYADIVITSREKLSSIDDFEDVYSLPPLITDDAFVLFNKHYGNVTKDSEIRILRQDILEDLLNNNPLAIKLVTGSRTRFKHISELRDQLKQHFFESLNEDYSSVYKNNADLNIERTKSIYQSINYSYSTLNTKEKIAFELLSLFPDGISLSNFKKCFEKSNSSNNINDREFRILRDKSLVEDYNGILQLQPIIRRFAEHQFSKRNKDLKNKYCLDAYSFNCYILKTIQFVEKKKTTSEALKFYNNYKNNLLNVLSYMPDIGISTDSDKPEKKYLLNFIHSLEDFVVSEKQIKEYLDKLDELRDFFKDLPNAETLINVLGHYKTYYYKEFDNSYKELIKLLPESEMEKRVFINEDYIERRYNDIISMIHSMEGYTLQRLKTYMLNDDTSTYQSYNFFYLGIANFIEGKKKGFYNFEYDLMYNRLDIQELEEYINSLYSEEHLEIMQSTYTLSKVKAIDVKTIQKLVVTNPYTKGLKKLMFAFNSKINAEKIQYFEEALENLSHIKYYYLEALYYYCIFLKATNVELYNVKLTEAKELCAKFYYQYLHHLFSNIDSINKTEYKFNYSFYPLENLEEYVKKHNTVWALEFKKEIEL